MEQLEERFNLLGFEKISTEAYIFAILRKNAPLTLDKIFCYEYSKIQ